MANPQISKGKIQHVIWLHAQGVPKLQISTATGLSRNTVRRYLTAFTELETTREAIMPLSDKEFYEFFRLDPVVDLDTRVGVLHEFLKQNDRKMSQREITLSKLYALYAQDHAGGYHRCSWSFSWRQSKTETASGPCSSPHRCTYPNGTT